MSNLISVALYVLQALGLYTIAKRRGIANPWLAWIPFGVVWILGSIADDYRARCGKPTKHRVVMLVLSIVVLVLAVVALVTMCAALLNVLTAEELMDVAFYSANATGDLYAPSEEELIQQLTETMDSRLTDANLNAVMGAMLASVGVSLALCGVAIASLVFECISMYKVFESCEPATKMVYFLVGMFVGLWPVFLIIVRNKDLGLPQGPVGLPGGFDAMPPQEPWNV